MLSYPVLSSLIICHLILSLSYANLPFVILSSKPKPAEPPEVPVGSTAVKAKMFREVTEYLMIAAFIA